MADLLTIDVDTAEGLQALTRLGDVLDRRLQAVARATGGRVVTAARARVRRATGQTADDIVMEDARDGSGVVVYTDIKGTERRRDRPNAYRWPNLDLGIEYGVRTMRHEMTAQPFIRPAAEVERGTHQRLVEDAVRAAIGEVGLGE